MKIAFQLLKYMIVAALSAASDWVVFVLLFAAFDWPLLAQATSRIVGGVISFCVNKYWSFQSRQHARASVEAPRFLVLFVVSFLLSLSLFSGLIFIKVQPYWAKLLTDTTCFFLNFLVMRFWVYRPQSDGRRPRPDPGKPLSSVH